MISGPDSALFLEPESLKKVQFQAQEIIYLWFLFEFEIINLISKFFPPHLTKSFFNCLIYELAFVNYY